MTLWRTILFLLPILIANSCIGQSLSEQATRSKEKPRSGLECKIWGQGARLSDGAQQVKKGNTAIVQVEFTNHTKNPIELNGMSVYLRKGSYANSEPEYYALVDIKTMSSLEIVIGPNGAVFPKKRLTVGTDRPIQFGIDITELKWAKYISSILPSATFFGVIPDGQFSEYLVLNGQAAGSRFEIESNRIAIEVRR